ncbi:hypothetical protein [Streptomyces sp. NPDC018711]|uniref:hypothetical protein n=1 Tax=Streptomyces sp. NPDC018711 TaxID=3365052 RepID=UPI0037A9044F
MSIPTGGFAAPREAADAIVDEILRRRLTVEDARRQDRRLRARQTARGPGVRTSPCGSRPRLRSRGLLLELAHLLGGEGDLEVYVQESVQRRHLTATVPGAATGEVVLSREGLALKPS